MRSTTTLLGSSQCPYPLSLLLASAAQSRLLQAATFALREGSPTVVAYIDSEDPDTVVIAHSPACIMRHRYCFPADGKVVVIGDDPNTMSHAVLEDRAFQK
jgi:hypothetical protein